MSLLRVAFIVFLSVMSICLVHGATTTVLTTRQILSDKIRQLEEVNSSVQYMIKVGGAVNVYPAPNVDLKTQYMSMYTSQVADLEQTSLSCKLML